ncbi:Com family DNA-binding transcriptional regulator [Phreatobacter stygius]|uniref:Com family DNA-binding transcriptional regulator n=1 Tax=Phreatobacter stygius TaxID=1940610 RepID=A0A4D7B7I4_9HYPH|nr:Com family DNA-binding transcriptional regulator [Phreatobacter stygius]
MENIRCGSCSALLLRMAPRALSGRVDIKCRRCGTLNSLRPSEPAPERHAERPAGDAACRGSKSDPSDRPPSIGAMPSKS